MIETMVRVRSVSLDRIRGLAIVLMILDHILDLTHELPLIRMTVTRLSMPLFFIISGHLVKRVNARTFQIMVIGFILPISIPWIDNPNVLFWYAVGTIVVVYVKQKWLIILAALTMGANHYALYIGSSYDPLFLIAFMAIGSTFPREYFSWGNRLPAFFTFVGKYPLSIYLGHLFLLTGILT